MKFCVIGESESVVDILKDLPMGTYFCFVESSYGKRCLSIFNNCICFCNVKLSFHQKCSKFGNIFNERPKIYGGKF